MKLGVVANDLLRDEFLQKSLPVNVEVCFVTHPAKLPADVSVIIDLLFDNAIERTAHLQPFLPKPVFVHAVNYTLKDIGQPFIRVNAWATFLKRAVWEIVAAKEQQATTTAIVEQLGWRCLFAPDVAGLVTARIVACIINEAYFTLEAGVSTKQDIDIAMRLGTNHPYGPFEWSEKIGLKNIHALLQAIAKENNSYNPCPLLTRETFV